MVRCITGKLLRMVRSDFSLEPTVCPQHVDEVNLKKERSLSEYDDKNNDNDKINIEQSSGDLSIEALPNEMEDPDITMKEYVQRET
nr:hypothetical protein [Tanacetum cinerariifolium]